MKIRILSDLHIETHKEQPDLTNIGEDVLVILGDIADGRKGLHWLKENAPRDTQILVVLGNHDYYGEIFQDLETFALDLFKDTNIKVLLDETFEYKGVDFIGGTMWTNFNALNNAPLCKKLAKHCIIDFGRIHVLKHFEYCEILENFTKPIYGLLTPEEVVLLYQGFEDLLDWELNRKDKQHLKKVVLTHFVPTMNACHPRFAGNELNAYFVNNMESYFDKVDAWLFGHTHDFYDFKMNGARLVCNPAGYGRENANQFKKEGYIIEV